MIRRLVRFLRREDGPTATEYSVLLALMVLACVAGVRQMDTNSRALFTSSASTVGGVGTP